MNIDETKIEAAITEKTKVICPVHYAGVACEMDTIMDIARRHNLMVVEDAAQGVMSTYKGRALGTIGDFGCYSFHETKNYSMGEGGAIIINNSAYIEKAEILREKGTNRSQFFRGQGSEDLEFMLRVIDSYNSTLCINKRYYHYVMNQNSITNSFNEKNAYSVLQCFKKMEDVIINKNEIVKDSFYIRSWNAICASIISGFMNPNNSLKYREKRKKTRQYLNNDFCIKTIKKVNILKLSFTRALVLIFSKTNLYFLIYLMAMMRNKQKGR